MPRKKNRRKEVQATRRKAEAARKPKSKRVAVIGHAATGSTGLALAIAASGILGKSDQSI